MVGTVHTARGGPVGANSLRQSINLPKTARGPVVKRLPSAGASPAPLPVPANAKAAAGECFCRKVQNVWPRDQTNVSTQELIRDLICHISGPISYVSCKA